MLTSDHRYRLLSFGDDSYAAAEYGQAERVYLDSIGATARTNTNEIAYWKDRYNEQFPSDKLFTFGFLQDDEVIGFALVFYFSKHNMLVVDHIAIKEPSRHFGAFFKFKEMIEQWLRDKTLQIDYVVAEIVTSKQGDPHPVEPQLLIQLLKQQGFKVAHIPYYTPSIREDEYTSRIDAALMIYRRERGNTIGSAKLLLMLECILTDLYIRWYTPHSRNLSAFRKQLAALRRLYKKELAKDSVVELNGNWAQPHRRVPEDQDGGSANFAIAGGLFVLLTLIAAVLAGASYYFKVGAMGIVLIFSVALLALLTILALWHRSASAQADKVLKLLITLVRGHKKIG